MPHLLTPDEAADLLQMDTRTLLKWARDGYVPAHGLGLGKRRLWRFIEKEILQWVEEIHGDSGKQRGGR